MIADSKLFITCDYSVLWEERKGANEILICVWKGIKSQLREALVPLSDSNEIPSKICCFWLWAVSQQKGTDKSGRIQGETSRCSVGLEADWGRGGKAT